MSAARSGMGGLMAKAVGLLPEAFVRRWLVRLANWWCQSRPADQGLRFLLELDNQLYTLQGAKSREYGGGVHTKHRHTRYHQFFIEHLRAGESVLDIGCGDGSLSRDMAQSAGVEVLGMDLVPGNVERARERNSHPRVEYRVGDALAELPRREFAVVVLSNVLEHLPGRAAFLRAVMERVRPERLLIRVPLFERDWRVPLKQELGVEWRADPTHHTEYTLESFAAEMAEAGLVESSRLVRWGEIWAEVRPREA